MSTLRATNIKHELSATNQIVLGSDGSIGGTLGDTLAAKADTSSIVAPGLVLITTGTLSGSATSINNCFTSTYSNYLMTVEIHAKSASSALLLRWRASGSDDTANSYVVADFYQTWGATITGESTTQTSLSFGTAPTGTSYLWAQIFRPQESAETGLTFSAILGSSAVISGYHRFSATTQFDGVTLYPASGTFTSGTVRIYGQRNS